MRRFVFAQIAAGLMFGAAAIATVTPAQALPAYARQTGQPCSTCHVGGFGPQLTPFGRNYKLRAYGATQSWAKAIQKGQLPFSAMFDATFTHTAKDQSSPPGPNYSTNDNVTMQDHSFFVAGKLAPGLGSFAQMTYSGISHRLAMDNIDIRYAREFSLMGKGAVAGVTLNNNPTIQDVWNTTPGWGFPYMSSGLALTPSAPLLTGALSQQVVGVSPYLWINDKIYLELGAYKSLSARFLNNVNHTPGPLIAGTAPYWRVAYNPTFGNNNIEVGMFGLSAGLEPDRISEARDQHSDVGLDASWQRSNDKGDILSVDAAYIDERQKLNNTFGAGGAANLKDRLHSITANAAYHWGGHYGVTAGVFDIGGTTDNLLYTPNQDTGSRTGSPNSAGYILQGDWTPWGQADSWRQPWINLRLGIQYTGYTKFNGASSNYDGFGRNASDNNTLTVFAWTAF